MKNILHQQYEFIQGSRDELLRYCSQISPEHFAQPLDKFAHTSMRNLLLHVANASLYWLAEFALQKPVSYGRIETINSVKDLEVLFVEVDKLMAEFLSKFSDHNQPFTGWVKWVKKDITVTPVQIYTHVVTHFFHHKGQILTMSRHLGYTPVDTDVIRF